MTNHVIEPVTHVRGSGDKDLMVNPEAWNEPPDDLKGVVEDAHDHTMKRSGTAYDEANEGAKSL